MSEQRSVPALFYFSCFATVGLGFVLPVLPAVLISLLIIGILSWLRFSREWADFLFLKMNFKTLSWFVAAFTFAVGCVCVVLHVLHGTAVQVEFWAHASLGLLLTILLQSLVEEILFRVFLLRDLLSRWFTSKMFVILISAAFFSIAHLVNYRLREGVLLSWAPLLSLLLMSFAASFLFFRNRHIFGVWGFHAGWNFARFSSELNVSGKPVSEAQSFEILEGSQACLVLAVMLCVLSCYPPVAANAKR